jgi:transcriptional regulator with XRE-family HTH domain
MTLSRQVPQQPAHVLGHFGGFPASATLLASQGVPKRATPQPESLADRIAVAIRLSGLKDAEVARRAEVDADWLAGVKSRTRPNKNPDPKKLRRVAKVVGVPFRWFAASLDWYDEEEDPKEDWRAMLWADDRLDDEGKKSIQRLVELELGAAERAKKKT